MKNISILFLLLAIPFFSCEPPDDDVDMEDTSSTVFTEPFYPGFFRVNGQDIQTTEVSSSNYTVVDKVDASSLPDANLFSFSIAIAIPIDANVQIESELDNVSFMREDGTFVPPFFQGSAFRSTDVIDGVTYELYDFNFSYPTDAPTVTANTIREFQVIVTTNYFDNSGEFLEDIIFNYTVNVLAN